MFKSTSVHDYVFVNLYIVMVDVPGCKLINFSLANVGLNYKPDNQNKWSYNFDYYERMDYYLFYKGHKEIWNRNSKKRNYLIFQNFSIESISIDLFRKQILHG